LKSKMGRPKSENPRDTKINIRLTRDELEMLQSGANKLGVNRTTLIIMSVKKLLDEWDEKNSL